MINITLMMWCRGTAGTVLASVRALGGTVGITIFASIYGNAMKGECLEVYRSVFLQLTWQ